MRAGWFCPAGSGAENPKPGSDGMTTSNASAGSAPCATGSVSGPIKGRNSKNELAHPRVSTSGTGAAPAAGVRGRCGTRGCPRPRR